MMEFAFRSERLPYCASLSWDRTVRWPMEESATTDRPEKVDLYVYDVTYVLRTIWLTQ